MDKLSEIITAIGIEPYYRDEYGVLYCADCLDILPKIPDKSIDLVVTSPPYNLGSTHHTGSKRHSPYSDNMPESEYQAWQIGVLGDCYRTLSDNSSCFYNHQIRFKRGETIIPYRWLDLTKFSVRQEITWNRGTPNMDDCRFFPFTERIYHLTKGNPVIVNIGNWTDDWHIPPTGTGGAHTRQYPLDIPLRCVAVCEAAIILDPFCGSGTTLVAAKQLGRKYIGVEISEAYCKICVERLKQRELFNG